MLNDTQADRAAPAAAGLRERIMSFMRGASTEITPSEESLLPDLASVLPSGTRLYVAHTPKASFSQVIHAALAARRAGLKATPHIAVRRVATSHILRRALDELSAGGVRQVLLIAGDAAQPVGEYSSTLDVLESRIFEDSGISDIGIAGHPEGHNAVAANLLWAALEAKQALAVRAAMHLHIVTQFGLDAGAFEAWQRELVRRRIHLPVRVGIAGPASPARLAHFAIQCGVGASVRVLLGNLNAATHSSGLAISPDRHLLRLLAAPVSAQIIAPHFFAFGGALKTARWMQKMAAGAFAMDARGGRLTITDR